MSKVRAKFKCIAVTSFEGGGDHRKYAFGAVSADSNCPEDQRFHKYTPSGTLEIYVDNPSVNFEPGKAYYLDFTAADQ